jgi:hypothetical protein
LRKNSSLFGIPETPLPAKHHEMVHHGEIVFSGFVIPDEELRLHYEEKKKL